MRKDITEIKVFVSGPSDVENEKDIVKSVCGSLSKMKDKEGIIVTPIHWNEDVIPQITGEAPQIIINNYLEKSDYDIFIGVLWKRFGDQQENGLTPTEEEFEHALNRYKVEKRPLISVFFKNETFYPEGQYATKQFLAVQKFSDRIKSLGLYKSFFKERKFHETVYETINDFISKLTEIESTSVNLSLIRIQYEKVSNYLGRKVCPANKYRNKLNFWSLGSDKHDVLDIIEKENKIVIIGDAGVGKTTELRRIASHFSDEKSNFIPFYIKLNQYVDQNIEDFLPNDWQSIPDYNLLVILDGLDEIESKNKSNAIRKIELFSEQHTSSKIVVSSRSNFYQSGANNSPGTLSNFRAFTILPIEYSQIEEYIKANIAFSYDDFINEIHLHRLTDLLYIPFYLTELIKLYNIKNKLMTNKSDLFGEFITLRIESDELHYRTTTDLKSKRNTILNALERIALGAEIIGKNNITNEELERIIPDIETLNLLKHCSLINKSEGNNTIWQYEHNSIQEFLAARLLSKQSFDTIKSFISFEPDFKKVIPSWLNTVSFLFSLIEEESFIDWILENEPDICVKFENDKIDSSIRIKVFNRIFEDHKTKQIWINRDKYRYDELAKFGQDNKTVEYLIYELESATHYTIASNALKILAKMRIQTDYRDRLKDNLVKVALNDFITDIPDNVQQDALRSLSDLNFNSKDIVDKIVSALNKSDSDWLRYGLYYFLHSSDYLNEYIDVFLDGIKYIKFNTESSGHHRSRLMNESIELIEGIKKVSDKKAVIKILNYFIANDKEIYDLFMGNHDITFIAEKTSKLYLDGNKDLFDISLKFLLKLFEGHHEEEAKQYETFFEKTKTSYLAFQSIVDMKCPYKEEILSDFATTQGLKNVLDKYDCGEFSEDDVWRLLHTLRWRNKPMFDFFNKSLNDKYNGRFEVPSFPDWDKLRMDRSKKELDLLFDKNSFISEIKYIYENENKHTLTAIDLSDIKKAHFPETPYTELAFRTLRRLAEKGSISFNESIDKIDKYDWDYFAISNIYEKMRNNPELELSTSQKNWIETWCLSNEKQVNFKTAITKTGENSFSVRWNAIFLWFFYRKYELRYTKSTLLDMLSFDHRRKGIEYLEKALPKKEMTKKIIDNLYQGIEITDVLENHLKYCLKYKIEEVLPFAFKAIKDKEEKNEVRRISLEAILNINNDFSDLDDALYEIKDEFKWELIEKLIDKSERLYDYLRTMFQDSSLEDKIKLCNYLINYQDVDALSYYVEWIKEKNSFDRQMYNTSYLPKLKTEKAIPHLIELFAISYRKEFQDPDPFDRLERLILEAFKSISLESQYNYRAVRNSIEDFITSNIKNYKNLNWLYSFLNQLEQQYYATLAQNITIDNVLVKLEKIKET
jgi:GTPase SAR1 family protein